MFSRIHHLRILQTTILLAAAALCGGCGKAVGTVNGTVTFKGQPLPGGSVMFLDAEGVIHQAAIDANGQYTVSGVSVGDAKVAVGYVDERINEHARAVAAGLRSGGAPGSAPLPQLDMNSILVLPPLYADHNSSGLSTKVNKGTNTYDVVLVESATPIP